MLHARVSQHIESPSFTNGAGDNMTFDRPTAMTDDTVGKELTEANRREVHPVCYAVFPWTWDWEMPIDVWCTWNGLHRRTYRNVSRICVLQFLTREECICLHLCCKDALEHMNFMEDRNDEAVWDNEWFYQTDDYDSDSS